MKINGSEFLKDMGATLRWQADGSVIADVTLTARQEGPPKHAHGGALASLLDEAMGAAAWRSGAQVVAVHLSFDYKHPVPLGAVIRIVGKVESKDGRKVFALSHAILPDGRVAVSGRGIFVEAPQLFADDLPFDFSMVPENS